MTSTALFVAKGTGLVKTNALVRDISRRVEHARQLRNERVARAEAEYMDAIEQIGAAIAEMRGDATASPTSPAAEVG